MAKEEFFNSEEERTAFEQSLDEEISYNGELRNIIFEVKCFLKKLQKEDEEFCSSEFENIDKLEKLVSSTEFLMSPPRGETLLTAKTTYLAICERFNVLREAYDKQFDGEDD